MGSSEPPEPPLDPPLLNLYNCMFEVGRIDREWTKADWHKMNGLCYK